MARRLLILGCTGSIGRKALEVAADYPDEFVVAGLGANRDLACLASQVEKHRPEAIAVCAPEAEAGGREIATSHGAKFIGGPGCMARMVEDIAADIVVVATVGFAGLHPTLRAIELGRTVALANKEVLVTAGDLVMEAARRHGVDILPIDSEHNAVFQCLHGNGAGPIKRLILTASGGPFRGMTREGMNAITPTDALNHPTWKMGPKISVDSATLMNKGFEVIEGKHLFGVPVDQIDVVIHPQSIVHSMVEFVDGSILAQLGFTDMYMPIQNVLFHPRRVANKMPELNLAAVGSLTFEAPDRDTFPCLGLAYESVRRGGTCPAVLNAANEIAVERFLGGDIPFLKIPDILEETLGLHDPRPAASLEDIERADAWARCTAKQC